MKEENKSNPIFWSEVSGDGDSRISKDNLKIVEEIEMRDQTQSPLYKSLTKWEKIKFYLIKLLYNL